MVDVLMCLCCSRYNLVQLFFQNELTSHLRKMVVDLEVNVLLYLILVVSETILLTLLGCLLCMFAADA